MNKFDSTDADGGYNMVIFALLRHSHAIYSDISRL